MPNFNSANGRNQGINNMPRLSFLPPVNQNNAGQSNTMDYINYCGTGCQLEFVFNNIRSCRLDNDGKFFKITLPDDQKNYIKWNGSSISGLELKEFYLKEIYFGLPAKDKVITPNIDRSIQYYFTYVNPQHSIMIVISVIGQVNNLGNNGITNGFRLLGTLATQIPMAPGRNNTLSNLNQFNVGVLIPDNKTFFTTLVEEDTVQYIILSTMVDVPVTFFNNLVARVYGNIARYNSINQNFRDNPPRNPPGTIIFINENINPTGLDESLVCDSSCNQVPSNIIQPVVGSSTAGGSIIIPAPGTPGAIKLARAQEEDERCLTEEVEPGKITNVRASVAGGQIEEETAKTSAIISIVFSVLFNVLFIACIFGMLYMYFGLHKSGLNPFKVFFSKLYWNAINKNWLIFVCIANVLITVFFSLSTAFAAEALKEKDVEEPEEVSNNNNYWIFMLVGCIIFFVTFMIIGYNYFTKFRINTNANRINLNRVYGTQNASTQVNSLNLTHLNRISGARIYELSQPVKNAIIRLSNKYPDFGPLKSLRPLADTPGKVLLNPSQFNALVQIASTKNYK